MLNAVNLFCFTSNNTDGIFEEEEDMYDVPAFGRNKIKEEELQNILSGHGAVEGSALRRAIRVSLSTDR